MQHASPSGLAAPVSEVPVVQTGPAAAAASGPSTVTGTVVDVHFTRGSPFGEQWWTVDVAGTQMRFAMWLDLRQPERWPRTGEEVVLQPTGPMECGNIICSPCADLVAIHRS